MQSVGRRTFGGKQGFLATLLISGSISVLPFSAHAALTTSDLNSGLSPLDVATSLLGGGITISNVTYTGANPAAGQFSGGTGIIGFEDGIVLSSGNIADIVGPNTADDTTTSFGNPGDADLDSLIPGFTTHDAAVLEFDFIPIGDEVTFQYVFSSEEYNEFVNSPFNDVFGFFINGVNYALLPDGVTPVAINNVNGGNPFGTDASNPAFYINNDLDDGGGSIDIEADGLTVVLTLKAPVNAGAVNHIKLAVADAGDFVLDSWVFIKAGSFKVPEDCTNGIDDDQDGLVDNADPDCQVCGDGDVDPGEECDDGNTVDGDGCSAVCELENEMPDCSAATPSVDVIWPPNHKFVPVNILGVTDTDADEVSITIDSISQDEPVKEKGTGSGNTCPDAMGVGTDTGHVRAERAGSPKVPGDGRVYHIAFTADDGQGGTCTGEVLVCVPHDQGQGIGCVDQGPLFDSTVCP